VAAFPGRQRAGIYAGVRGEQLRPGENRDGVVDNGSAAWPERIEEARRNWPQARPEDYERVGRRYRDRATGIEYKPLPGAALLCAGQESTRGASCFIVDGGRIVVLRRADYEEELHGPVGFVVARRLDAVGPSRGGII
jgi:hypothetical protein